MNILWLAIFLLLPAPIIFLNNRVKLVEKIGIIFICYFLGIVAGNLNIIPESFKPVQQTLMTVSVGLAMPLLLFSLDIKKWFKTAKSGLMCMLYAVIAIAIVTFVLQLIFGRMDPDTPKYAAMATGVYTGGTPNIAAISEAVGVSEDTYTIFNTYDMVVSMCYVLLLTSYARPLMEKVFKLRPFTGDRTMGQSGEAEYSEVCYKGIFKPRTFIRLMLAFLLSAAICLASDAIGKLCKGYEDAVTILLITTLAVLCSFWRPVRETKMTTQLGMYIIYIFCFSVASMAKLEKLIDINYILLIYVIVSVFGSFILHAFLCRLGKIDSETMVVTSVSAICSPPFVPVIAGRLQNKAAMVSGIATGIIGYAIGNYVGIGIFLLYTKLGL